MKSLNEINLVHFLAVKASNIEKVCVFIQCVCTS
jgi:hypothetical protein